MGLQPDVFDGMTVVEFVYMSWGYAEKTREQTRAAWELQRWDTYIQVAIQLAPGDRQTMTRMFPLPWDTQLEEQQPMTLEERRESARKLIRGE